MHVPSLAVLWVALCSLLLARAEGDCKYATRDRITTLFQALDKKDYPVFFAAVVDNVNWTVEGTHPLSGTYLNKTTFVINTIARLARIQNNTAPNNMHTFNIVGGCNETWSSQEISSHQVMLNGKPSSPGSSAKLSAALGFRFVGNFNWMTRWNEQGMIVQARAYLDSELVAKVVMENEITSNSTFSTPRLCIQPGPGGIPNLTDVLGYQPMVSASQLC